MGVVLACLASEGAGSACGRAAAWRHSAATVTIVAKMTHRYYRRRLTGSTGEPNKQKSDILFGHLNRSKKSIKIQGGSQQNKEASHNFI